MKKNENSNVPPPAGRAARDAANGAKILERRRNRGKGLQADWASAEAEALARVICAVTAAGCAITFGYTRDGGALTITVLAEGETDTEYVRPTEDLGFALAALTEDFSKV